ncbi:MAG: PilZ domain-containing protein [Candidatus Omnitrophica bacterium]|nr:PilZ domain-containing protein [Candidatus Omnitrophota bacterium]MCB9747715.1 PilZ domain-containing protein [Candidatus Omnitrophota bacterium]
MILKRSSQERRQNPRIENNVPLKICCDNGDFVTETGNISRSGAYCKVNRYIEPMTKLKIQLLIPLKSGNKITTKKISCQGVIVRIESADKEQEYNIAIFFNDISQRDAENIADYVSTYLEQEQES